MTTDAPIAPGANGSTDRTYFAASDIAVAITSPGGQVDRMERGGRSRASARRGPEFIYGQNRTADTIETAPAAKPRRRSGRRMALAGAAVVLASATVVANVALMELKADLGRQRHGLSALDEREIAAAQSVDELLQRSQAADARSGTLSAEVGGLKTAVSSQLDPVAVARQVQPSVVMINTPRGEGSGFVISSQGGTSTIVTAYHVVADVWASDARLVRVTQGPARFEGTVVRVNEQEDLALLTVPSKLPALAVATAPPAVGDPVVVAGAPFGFQGTVTSGIVSALRPLDGKSYIQFSAPTNPGNSGGPVVDRSGRVLGIVRLGGDPGMAFAIPASRVCAGLPVC